MPQKLAIVRHKLAILIHSLACHGILVTSSVAYSLAPAWLSRVGVLALL
jgi:hypothetical protein